jgi:uncharacterized protein (TIGR02246 family)
MFHLHDAARTAHAKCLARIWAVALATATVTLVGAAYAEANDEAAIIDLMQQYAASYSERDAAAVAELFTEQALFIAPDGTRLDGRQEIEAMFRVHFDSGSLPLVITPLETVVIDDTAYVLNTYAALGDDGEPIIEGYGMTIWLRVDSEWLWHRNVANVIVSEPNQSGSSCVSSPQPGTDVIAVAACP